MLAQVYSLAMQDGAGMILRGLWQHAEHPLRVSAVLSAQSLVEVSPQLIEVARSGGSLSCHVVAEEVEMSPLGNDFARQLVVKENHEAVLQVASIIPDAVLMFSSTPQESSDLALASHLIADRLKCLSLLVSSPFSAVRTKSNVERPVASDVCALVSDLEVESDCGDSCEAIDRVFEDVTNKTGAKRYRAFEYYGSRKARTVVAGLSLTEDVISAALRGQHDCGILNIRVYRPWSIDRFLNALPQTVQQLVVLSSTSSALVCPLVSDIYATIRTQSEECYAKIILSTSFAERGEISASVLARALGVELQSSRNQSALSFRTAIWERETCPDCLASHDTGNNIGRVIAETTKMNISAVDSSFMGVKRTELRAGDWKDDLDCVFLCDFTSLEYFDCFSEIAPGGSVIVNHTGGLASLQDKISPLTLRCLEARDVNVWVLDLSLYAGKQTDALLSAFLLRSAILKRLSIDELVSILSRCRTQTLESVAKTLSPITTRLLDDCTQTADGETPSHSSLLRKVPSSLVFNDLNVGQIRNQVEGSETDTPANVDREVFYWSQLFPKAFSRDKARSESTHAATGGHDQTFMLRLTENRRLTPDEYDRNVFHLEFDTEGTGLQYRIGDALGVFPVNDTANVISFLSFYGVDCQSMVRVANDTGEWELYTAEQLMSHVLDIFGRPSKAFYQALALHARDPIQQRELARIISVTGLAEFEERTAETLTFADLLREFDSAHPSLAELAELVPRIKPRHYSIASSNNLRKKQVHLLVVEHTWTTPGGRDRIGLCTRFLSSLPVGTIVKTCLVGSVLRLPCNVERPIVMAGLGTGMAPFRAFLEERQVQRSAAAWEGGDVGESVLYFGSRHRKMEYLYGEELEALQQEGSLNLRLAFSRDQVNKVYIQHKIAEDSEVLYDLLVRKEGSFYLCGPTWPAADVQNAIEQGFASAGNMSLEEAHNLVEQMKSERRYLLEVY